MKVPEGDNRPRRVCDACGFVDYVIPWGELAFPSVRWALDHYRETEGQGTFPARVNPKGERGDYRP